MTAAMTALAADAGKTNNTSRMSAAATMAVSIRSRNTSGRPNLLAGMTVAPLPVSVGEQCLVELLLAEIRP